MRFHSNNKEPTKQIKQYPLMRPKQQFSIQMPPTSLQPSLGQTRQSSAQIRRNPHEKQTIDSDYEPRRKQSVAAVNRQILQDISHTAMMNNAIGLGNMCKDGQIKSKNEQKPQPYKQQSQQQSQQQSRPRRPSITTCNQNIIDNIISHLRPNLSNSLPLRPHRLKYGETAAEIVHQESNQVDVRCEDSLGLSEICNRVINLKRIEKYEKLSIKQFYNHEYDNCYQTLAKCQAIMNKQQIVSHEHSLYLSYLQSEFSHKQQKWDDCARHLQIAKQIIKTLTAQQKIALKDYVLQVEVIDVCLAVQTKRYDDAIRLSKLCLLKNKAESAMNNYSKARRRLAFAESRAFISLRKYQQAIAVIDSQRAALQLDAQLMEDKRASEESKMFLLKIQCLLATNKRQETKKQLQCKLGLQGNGFIYDSNLCQIYYQLLLSMPNSLISQIDLCRKWVTMSSNYSQKISLLLRLYRMYFEVGDYTTAKQIFCGIALPDNIRYFTALDYEILAQIRHFEGKYQQAVQIMLKAVQIELSAVKGERDERGQDKYKEKRGQDHKLQQNVINIFQKAQGRVAAEFHRQTTNGLRKVYQLWTKMLSYELQEATRTEIQSNIEKYFKTTAINKAALECYTNYLRLRGYCDRADRFSDKILARSAKPINGRHQ